MISSISMMRVFCCGSRRVSWVSFTSVTVPTIPRFSTSLSEATVEAILSFKSLICLLSDVVFDSSVGDTASLGVGVSVAAETGAANMVINKNKRIKGFKGKDLK